MTYIIKGKFEGRWTTDVIGYDNFPRSYSECASDILELGDLYPDAEYRIVEASQES